MSEGLTTPDLIVLSLLGERPMHGYQLNVELERREIRDWGGISRPQVYYSLEKLARLRLIEAALERATSGGPERRSYKTTRAGLEALADRLEDDAWARRRAIPPFLTWMALSGRARPQAVRRQIERRRNFLEAELARERATMKDLQADSGAMVKAAKLMVGLTIEQFEVELRWLDKVRATLP